MGKSKGSAEIRISEYQKEKNRGADIRQSERESEKSLLFSLLPVAQVSVPLLLFSDALFSPKLRPLWEKARIGALLTGGGRGGRTGRAKQLKPYSPYFTVSAFNFYLVV
jgi:hypothetical protein